MTAEGTWSEYSQFPTPTYDCCWLEWRLSSTEAKFVVLDRFIQIHGKAPSSIITDDQQTVALAINELKDNEFFQGNHMLDPWHLLKSIKTKIIGY